MKLDAHTDDKEWRRAIDRLSVVMRKDVPTITKQSAGRACVNFARTTAPFGFSGDARMRVVKNITSDVSRVFRPIASVSNELEEKDRSRLSWLVMNKGPATVTKFLKSLGIDIRFRKTAPVNEMKLQRNKSGRVPRGRKPEFAVPTETRARLIAKAEKRVGLAKHGWTECARMLNRSALRVAPRWVKSSKGKPGAGTVVVTNRANGLGIQMTNNVPYVSRLLSETGIRQSKQREADFLRQEIKRRIQGSWK